MMTLRPAADHEIEAIADLVNGAYRGPAARAGWTTEADYIAGQRIDAATLRRQLARPGAVVLGLWDAQGGPLVGCLWLEPAHDDCWHLGMVTVRPDLQAGGLGRRLLEGAETWARERGARWIEMTVIGLRHSLIDWYERRGYRRTEETRPFPYGDARFGQPLRDDLAFVVLEKRL